MMRSNGMKVARTHIYDWLILMLLVVIGSLIHFIHPFHCFVGKGMMTNLMYPLKRDTVPFWAVPMYALLLPMVIFVVVNLWRCPEKKRDIYDLHHAVLGLLYSAAFTAVITDALKLAVGRPRPDFFWRCFPDGKDVYDQWGNVICHGKSSVVNEGHKSFPSEHTSWSFAGLGFLSLYLAGKIKAFDHKGHVAKLCIVFLPLLVASLVGVSRLDDHRHHRQDVIAGGLLGITAAVFCYLQFFPPPYHAQGWRPYASSEDVPTRQATETQNENRPDGRSSGIGCIPPTAGRSPQDMETGGSKNEVSSGAKSRYRQLRTGFTGSYYTATIVTYIQNEFYLVQEKKLLREDNSGSLREVIQGKDIHPTPPTKSLPTAAGFAMLDRIDALYSDRRWTGMMTGKEGSAYVVHFQKSAEKLTFSDSDLRMHLEWVNSNWIATTRKWIFLPQNHNIDS